MYVLTVARQLQFGQIEDNSRPPLWKQILLHFMMDKDYTWSALKHKKYVKNRLESNECVMSCMSHNNVFHRIRRKEREELERQRLAGEKSGFVRKTVNRTDSNDILAPRMHKMPIVDPSGFRDFNVSTHQSKNRAKASDSSDAQELSRKREKQQRELDKTREEKYMHAAFSRNARSSTFKDFNATSHQSKENGLINQSFYK